MNEPILSGYLDQIRAHFPAMQVNSARLNREGLVNDAVIVNEETVYRFPKTEEGKALLAYEDQVLAAIRSRVALPVPDLKVIDGSFGVYRYLPGRPLYLHVLQGLTDEVQDAIAGQVGRFLAELHAVPLSALPEGARAGGDGRGLAQKQALETLAEVRSELFAYLWADQRAWVEYLFGPVLAGGLDLDAFQPALIHNDLASYHIMLDPRSNRLAGVIDFGTARVGDPAKDFATLINTYGERFVRRMGKSYPLQQGMLERARFYAGRLELEWALHGVREQDPAWTLVHIGRARDVGPYGTRF